MKVICIDAHNPKDREKVTFEDYLIEGNTYTVVGHYYHENEKYYYLQEKPRLKHRSKRVGYNCKRFIKKEFSDIQNKILSKILIKSNIDVSKLKGLKNVDILNFLPDSYQFYTNRMQVFNEENLRVEMEKRIDFYLSLNKSLNDQQIFKSYDQFNLFIFFLSREIILNEIRVVGKMYEAQFGYKFPIGHGFDILDLIEYY